MKLSTKGRYGLRAIIDIAVYSQEEPVSLSSITERTGISMNYLEQLVAKLKKAGLVNSIRGAQGGYTLAMNPEDISVGTILRALEGDLSPVECVVGEGKESPCQAADSCVTKIVWQKIYDSINAAIDDIKLSEMVEETKKCNGVLDTQSKNQEISC